VTTFFRSRAAVDDTIRAAYALNMIDAARIARMRELAAQHRAGSLSWEDLVTQAAAVLTPRAGEHGSDLIDLLKQAGDLTGDLVLELGRRDRKHWVWGLGGAGGDADDWEPED
jgi:hypothetical protein